MGRGLARILVVVDEREAEATLRFALGHIEGVTVDIATAGQTLAAQVRQIWAKSS